MFKQPSSMVHDQMWWSIISLWRPQTFFQLLWPDHWELRRKVTLRLVVLLYFTVVSLKMSPEKSATFEFNAAAKKGFHTNELIRPGRSERLLLWRLLRPIFSLIVSIALRLSKCCKSENLLFFNYKYPFHIDQCWYICWDSGELEPIPAEIGSLHQM